MSEMTIPEECVYNSVSSNILDVVQQRIEKQVILPSTSTFSSSSNPIIQIQIPYNSGSRLDLSSIYITATLTVSSVVATGAAGYGDPATVDDETTPHIPSSAELFSQISLMSANGAVIESITDSDVVNRIILLSCSQDWVDTVGSFGNNQLNRNKRTATWSGGFAATNTMVGTVNIKVDALMCLGFLSQNKYFPSHFTNGLILSLTMKSNDALSYMLYADTANTTTLSNVVLNYEDAIMKTEYLNSFNDTYGTSGFELLWPGYTVVNLRTPTIGTTSSVSLPFNLNLKRCKAICVVIRPETIVGKKDKNDLAFSSSGFEGGAFQLYLNGVATPAAPISTYSRMYEEWLKVCNLNKYPHCSLVNYKQFSTDDPSVAGNKATGTYSSATQPLGNMILCCDFEKYESNAKSGINLQGQHSLEIRWGSTSITNAVIQLVALHDRVGKFLPDGNVTIYQ